MVEEVREVIQKDYDMVYIGETKKMEERETT